MVNQFLHDGCIAARLVGFQDFRPGSGVHAFNVDVFFDYEWDAVKNAVLRMVFAPTVTEIRLPHYMWINLRDGIDFWTVVIILVDSVEIVGDKLSAGGFTGFQCCSNLFDGFALWIEFHARYVDRIG